MSVNIIEQLAHQQGVDNLPKVDPNTQDIIEKKQDTNLLLQAVIPSVLAGFYQFSRSDENAESLFQGNNVNDWTTILFGDDRNSVIEHIAKYASVSAAAAKEKLETVANSGAALLTDAAGGNKGQGLKTLLTDQRTNILQHLPGVIGVGAALNDTTLDDRTNKMEGPVSSLMHKIEKQFAATDVTNEKNF